jgi:GNAT superfamily N-acetyltransferase
VDKGYIERLCRKEFSKIGGLYLPDDKIDVVFSQEAPLSYSVEYKSSAWSIERPPKIEDAKDEPLDELTLIDFGVLPETYFIGMIEFISVNHVIRGLGYGREIMEAAEGVLRQTGQIAVGSGAIEEENSSFWEHMGYKLNEDRSAGVKLL